MNVLFLTSFLPSRCQSGSEIASQAIVDAIEHAGHDVTVVGYMRAGHDHALRPGEKCVGPRIMETTSASMRQIGTWMGRSLLSASPYCCSKLVSSDYLRTVVQLLQSTRYDLIVIDHIQMGWVFKTIPNDLPAVIVAHNIEAEIYQQLAQQNPSGLRGWALKRETRLMRSWESRYAQRASQVWTLSEHDRKHFQSFTEARQVHLHSFMIDGVLESQPPRFDVALMGMWTWQPNALGLQWFSEQVMPHLDSSIQVHVAGKGADWLKGRYPNLVYHGFVDDAMAFLKSARIIAIPGVAGGGVQIKTLDAIALGQPVVGSPIALRGIDNPPATVRMAPSAQAFADALQQLIKQPIDTATRQAAIKWSQQRKQTLRQQVAAAIDELVSL